MYVCMYICIYIYIYIVCLFVCLFVCLMIKIPVAGGYTRQEVYTPPPINVYSVYTQSPLQDSRLFGPRPWKILATTYEQMGS